jgi:hypothetical protein
MKKNPPATTKVNFKMRNKCYFVEVRAIRISTHSVVRQLFVISSESDKYRAITRALELYTGPECGWSLFGEIVPKSYFEALERQMVNMEFKSEQ